MTIKKLRLLIFISGGGSNLQAIIDHIDNETLDATIDLVISSNKNAFGLQRAKKANIQHKIISPDTFSSPACYEKTLLEVIGQRSFDLLILAGYMYILSGSFVASYQGRILNIHPSLLPKYKGLNTHRRALEAGEKQHGSTVHFVTSELDSGPIVLQARVNIEASDDEHSLQQKVLQQEHVVYSQAIQSIAEGKINYRNLCSS